MKQKTLLVDLHYFKLHISQADEYKGDKQRVSMAFDLFDTNFYEGDPKRRGV